MRGEQRNGLDMRQIASYLVASDPKPKVDTQADKYAGLRAHRQTGTKEASKTARQDLIMLRRVTWRRSLAQWNSVNPVTSIVPATMPQASCMFPHPEILLVTAVVNQGRVCREQCTHRTAQFIAFA